MGMYYDGYYEARQRVMNMSDKELYSLFDSLYGRENLPCNPTHEDLVREGLEQIRYEYTDTSSPEYNHMQFWVSVVKAMVTG